MNMPPLPPSAVLRSASSVGGAIKVGARMEGRVGRGRRIPAETEARAGAMVQVDWNAEATARVEATASAERPRT